MKKSLTKKVNLNFGIFFIFLLLSSCNEQKPMNFGRFLKTLTEPCANNNEIRINQVSSFPILKINAYGFGVHADRFGRPITLRPDFGAVQGEYLEIKPDAYGFGVHSDQYGRPVREYPWP